ncbi:FliG C-terminal domain-containing protein [Gallaecimonas kandeliae]|uniref:FliG C-terminal domain-containing protein n=1 Tax=Gallaecimonas kandeliae TaxID=3029055 RepID=UPI002647680F|nr:FliG C-terminal domain-containing protein [Gallaecimonas kandeliae]WKE66522.1 FliG C-terminal domain-containing protein [Gallaecimonas kandeliae]
MTERSDLDRAAILMLSMGEATAAKIMARLGRDEVQALSQRMAKLSGVSTAEAKSVMQGFFEHYREHSGISAASRQYLEKTLDLALGKRLARGMVDSIYGDALRQELKALQWVPAETLARFFRNEHPQLQAVLLAFLPPENASAVLGALPGEAHDDLLYRVANLKEVSEQVLDELKATLARCLQFVSEQSTAKVDGVRQAADILNRYQGDRGALMEMLRLHDQDTAGMVADNMYDFLILARQSDEVLQALVQEVPTETLALALKGADAVVRDALLAALPKRMAQGLEDAQKAMGLVPLSRAEQARGEIMALVRRLHEEQQLNFQLFEEKTVS